MIKTGDLIRDDLRSDVCMRRQLLAHRVLWGMMVASIFLHKRFVKEVGIGTTTTHITPLLPHLSGSSYRTHARAILGDLRDPKNSSLNESLYFEEVCAMHLSVSFGFEIWKAHIHKVMELAPIFTSLFSSFPLSLT